MDIRCVSGSYYELKKYVRQIRREVFIEEQVIPEDIEIDRNDERCHHVVIWQACHVIGTGRIDRDGKIGRIAVKERHRRKGVGRVIMQEIELFALRHNFVRVYLHAQIPAISFYERLGYVACSASFSEANIEHKRMGKFL